MLDLAVESKKGTRFSRMEDCLYIEISMLLCKTLTGVGRFVARLVESLNRHRPLRLVSNISPEVARAGNLSMSLLRGSEIVLEKSHLPPCHDDLDAWTRCVLHFPQQPHNSLLAAQSNGLYTWLHPGERHFARELCILYDFTPLIVPWAHRPETCADFGAFFGRTVALCDSGIAISNSTKADAEWLCELPNSEIVVGYPGPSMCVRYHAWPEPVTRLDNVILVVSTREPRKNGAFLLDWFQRSDAVSTNAELWWVGPKGWNGASEYGTQQTSRPRPPRQGRTVRFLGMVSDRRLCQLYQQATLSIYPSLYEGFGFPVLDSLRHGTPVVCSFNSSLQEFGGPGVFYFDACDPASLDAALMDSRRSGPAHISQSALDQRYSWDLLARTVLSLCA
jgi:glycosyltransferase involved in cell wall biosynthesis